MKKLYFIIFLFSLVSINGLSQTLIPTTGELLLPQFAYTGGNNTARVAYVCRLKITGLLASTTYRYTVGISTNAAINTTQGGGLMYSIRNAPTIDFGYIDGLASTKAVGGALLQVDIVAISASTYYAQFTTNASGEYTGWFAGVPNGAAAHFTTGSNAYFYVHVNNPGSYVVAKSFATTSAIKLLDYSEVASDNNGCTAFMGTSTVGNEKMVALYDNTDFIGRPVATAFTENDGINQASPYAAWYPGVNEVSGSWGALLPNNLSTVIKGIKFFEIDGSEIVLSNSPPNTSGDGFWNGISTVNPTGGMSTLLTINSINMVTLPVSLTAFSAKINIGSVVLQWSTDQELNNQYFELLRAGSQGRYQAIGTIKSAANGAVANQYRFTNQSPANGINYYQLKQVDRDGRSTLSKTIAVNYKQAATTIRIMSSSPGSITLALQLLQPQQGAIVLTAMDGKLLYTKPTNLAAGNHTLYLPLSLPKGQPAIVSYVSGTERVNLQFYR